MATNYPYYIPTYMDAGQMKKIFGQSKFRNFMDAVVALKQKYAALEKCLNQKLMKDRQFVILEYATNYNSKIVAILNYGEDNLIYVNAPKIMTK